MRVIGEHTTARDRSARDTGSALGERNRQRLCNTRHCDQLIYTSPSDLLAPSDRRRDRDLCRPRGARRPRERSRPAAKSKLAVALSIKKINFGKVPAGTRSSPQIVTLTNKSNVEISAPAVIVSGAGFSLDSNGCTGAILPAASCPVGVTFTPPKIGKFKNGLLKFTDAAAKSPQKVKLIGVGAIRPSPTATPMQTPTTTASATPIANTRPRPAARPRPRPRQPD